MEGSVNRSSVSEKSAFITKTYGWMTFALLVSAVVAWFTAQNIFVYYIKGEYFIRDLTQFGQFLFRGTETIPFPGLYIFVIAELITVIVLSARIRKMSVGGAVFAFLLYSALSGVTLSSIFIVYEMSSIVSAFIGTALMFGGMSLWGLMTKKDLSSFGHYLMMGLWGLIITHIVGWIVSWITGNPLTMLDHILLIASALIFTGLAAYDSWKVAKTAEYANGSDDYKKVSIIAALELYLDFINLFLALLRLFGKRK